MRPFWLRPKWVVGHVLVLVLVVTFVNLGLWQLRRLEEKRDRIADIDARGAMPVEPVGDLITPDAGREAAEAVTWRRVTANGRYDDDATVLVRNRSLNGQPGEHVLTPLVLADGTAVLVNRGWVPYAVDDPDAVLAGAEPPAGDVRVRGLLTAGQERGRFGPTDPAEGRLRQLARADIGRVQAQYPRPLLPVVLQLDDQDPAQDGELPIVLPEPERSEGPHLSYAVQWFLFATVGLVGWPLLLRNTARDERASDPPDGLGPGASGPFGPSSREAVDGPQATVANADRTVDERAAGAARPPQA